MNQASFLLTWMNIYGERCMQMLYTKGTTPFSFLFFLNIMIGHKNIYTMKYNKSSVITLFLSLFFLPLVVSLSLFKSLIFLSLPLSARRKLWYCNLFQLTIQCIHNVTRNNVLVMYMSAESWKGVASFLFYHQLNTFWLLAYNIMFMSILTLYIYATPMGDKLTSVFI